MLDCNSGQVSPPNGSLASPLTHTHIAFLWCFYACVHAHLASGNNPSSSMQIISTDIYIYTNAQCFKAPGEVSLTFGGRGGSSGVSSLPFGEASWS